MEQEVDIPVTYKKQEVIFKAQLIQHGYLHAFQIDVNNIPVLFEPDEERNYRAVIDTTKYYNTDKLDRTLLQAIISTLDSLS